MERPPRVPRALLRRPGGPGQRTQRADEAHEAVAFDLDQLDPLEEAYRCKGHVHGSENWTPAPTGRRGLIL